jgi:hypothetical protein
MRPPPPEPGNAGFRCPQCGRTFPDFSALRTHLALVHPRRPFPARCAACRLEFESPGDLKAHNQAVHGAPAD